MRADRASTVGNWLATMRGRRWWTILLRGIAAIVLGLIALFAPGLTFLSLVVLFGAFALVDGVLALAIGKRGSDDRRAWAGPIHGIASIVAGSIAILWPGITGLVLLFVIAGWAVATGVIDIYAAIKLRRQVRGEWLVALQGVLSIVFGVVLFISPLAGAIVLGLWVGVYALVLGGLLIATAFHVRTRYKAKLSGSRPADSALAPA